MAQFLHSKKSPLLTKNVSVETQLIDWIKFPLAFDNWINNWSHILSSFKTVAFTFSTIPTKVTSIFLITVVKVTLTTDSIKWMLSRRQLYLTIYKITVKYSSQKLASECTELVKKLDPNSMMQRNIKKTIWHTKTIWHLEVSHSPINRKLLNNYW